jgi:hypothetical protein
MAVGRYLIGGYKSRTFAERWNGFRWSNTATANPPSAVFSFLAGISCPRASLCIGVGAAGERTLVERWNGAKWHIVSSPNPFHPRPNHGALLTSVSCDSPSHCVATGLSDNFGVTVKGGLSNSLATLAERWTGTQWLITPTRNQNLGPNFHNLLLDVACVRASSCLGVGTSQRVKADMSTVLTSTSLIERWNGLNWSTMRSPRPSRLSALFSVSCIGTECMALGGYGPISLTGEVRGGPLAEEWNGVAWSVLPTARTHDPLNLRGVSCPRTNMCMAVGDAKSGTLSEVWRGHRWKVIPTPGK